MNVGDTSLKIDPQLLQLALMELFHNASPLWQARRFALRDCVESIVEQFHQSQLAIMRINLERRVANIHCPLDRVVLFWKLPPRPSASNLPRMKKLHNPSRSASRRERSG